jgi:2-C-methyl-D-erythritol 4-phosphate cytidylyltransferase
VLGAVWTIVVAAGTGARFGGAKQFADLGGRRVVDWSMDVAHSISDGVVLVVPADLPLPSGAVIGGLTRAESVRRGLAAVPPSAEIVIVHDAARPFADRSLFDAVVSAVRDGADGAVPGLPVSDTIKQVDETGVVVATPARASLVAVQTPQAFRAAVLRRAHRDEPEGTDDASLVEAIGGRVVIVAGDATNRKLTVPDDLDWARERVAVERR